MNNRLLYFSDIQCGEVEFFLLLIVLFFVDSKTSNKLFQGCFWVLQCIIQKNDSFEGGIHIQDSIFDPSAIKIYFYYELNFLL